MFGSLPYNNLESLNEALCILEEYFPLHRFRTGIAIAHKWDRPTEE
jgi:hypothetical protein